MIRLFVLAILVLAAWQGSIHYDKLLHPERRHEVLIENKSAVAIERVRVRVGDETVVRERIEPGRSSLLEFSVGPAGAFHLTWLPADKTLDCDWKGGHIAPPAQRHTLTVVDDKTVEHRAAPLPSRG